MKLNNKGWGTTEMLVISGCLLIALIVAIFFISKLYGSFGESINNRVYMDLETKLEVGAQKYITDNKINVTGTYRIEYSTLKAGYIDSLVDSQGNECNGYVIVNNINNLNNYKGYISCNNYQSANY